MTSLCRFTQCNRCKKFWHECHEECDDSPEDFYIRVCCLYCDSCQEEGCCPTYISDYIHECLELDCLLIDPNDVEMDSCSCYSQTISWLPRRT